MRASSLAILLAASLAPPLRPRADEPPQQPVVMGPKDPESVQVPLTMQTLDLTIPRRLTRLTRRERRALAARERERRCDR